MPPADRIVRRAVIASAAVLMAILALAGCSAPPPPPPPVVPPAVPRAPVFTQAQFDRILHGMTYGQVADLLGAESSRQESTYDQGSSDYVRPTLTAWHFWENEDGSFIKVGFIEKKVAEKLSENLPQ